MHVAFVRPPVGQGKMIPPRELALPRHPGRLGGYPAIMDGDPSGNRLASEEVGLETATPLFGGGPPGWSPRSEGSQENPGDGQSLAISP
jgi:hypothetical protein